MPVFLFDDLIFGPVRSRRLGVSLGVNLLPTHSKFCSYNCVYCECGWTKNRNSLKIKLPEPKELNDLLEQKLIELHGTLLEPDSITFAGNGEPTLHPQFAEIIKNTLQLRDRLAPKARVSVLSNGSMLKNQVVVEALNMVDNNILKLDGGNEEIIRSINMPLKAFRLSEYIEQLKRFSGNIIIQTLFLRGSNNGKSFDNTTEEEVNSWLEKLKIVNPRSVMIYAIERDTPQADIEKISSEELESIAAKVRMAGIEADVFA
ncbi:MAG: radical SAM protein [Bacteroidales bacterium]|nr:radical SAM protein [Bacteroidales bacterium]